MTEWLTTHLRHYFVSPFFCSHFCIFFSKPMWLPTTFRHSFHFKLEKPDNPHFECEKPDNLNFKLEKPDHLHFNREKPDHFRASSGIVPFELGSHIYINCIKSAVHSWKSVYTETTCVRCVRKPKSFMKKPRSFIRVKSLKIWSKVDASKYVRTRARTAARGNSEN